jgi:putative PEP-CTERM system TPR-repeat lipoprotein
MVDEQTARSVARIRQRLLEKQGPMRWTFPNLLARFARGGAGALLILGLLFAVSSPALSDVEPEESRAHYDKAARYVEAGKLRAAVIELKNSLQQDPANLEARLLLANVYLLLGDGASAESQLKAAERHGVVPDRIVALLGRALLLQGRFTEILRHFNPEGREPGIALELRLLRADAQAGLGHLVEARGGYEAVKESNAEDARVPLGLARIDLAEGKFDDVETHATAALALNPDLPEATLLRAEAQRRKGEPEDAVPFYRDVLDGEPVPLPIKARAHLGLAAALIALGRDPDAEAEISALQSVLPNSPLAAYLAAVIKVRANDFAAARNVLEGSARALEDFTPAQFLSGMVYYTAGEFETARSWLKRHLDSHPDNLVARKLLGATLLRLNAVPDAIAVLQPGLEQAPDDPQLLFLLGNAELRGGRAVKAAELLKRAAELAPKEPHVLGQLVISQIAAGQDEGALTAFETTLDLGADTSAIGYALVFSHLRQGEFESALKVAQSLRKRLPDSAVAANLEGTAQAALGHLDDARGAFEAALKIESDFHDARANLAALKMQAGDLDGAEADYLQILARDEKNAAALIGLAGFEHRRGNASASRDWLKKAVAANPKAIAPAIALAENYVAAEEVAAATELLESLTRQHPANPQALLALGHLQAQAGRPADAIGIYERLVKASGGAADARILLAQSHLAAGETKAARDVLEDSLADHPEHWPTAAALVDLVAVSEGQEASLAYAERLQRKFPDAPWSDHLFGDLHWRAGHFDEALAAYERGWAKAPTAALALALSRARLQRDASQKDGTATLAPLLQWLEAHPADDTVRLALGKTQLTLGDLAAARATYEALKASQADNPIVWNNLAWIYQQLGDERAAGHGERALELAPSKPEILDTLGWILLERDQIERAAKLLQQAHQAAPDNLEIAFHYAMALHLTGNDEAARKVLQSLLSGAEAFPTKSEAEALLTKLTP